MKKILIFLFLYPCTVFSQKDFDYTFYTAHADYTDTVSKLPAKNLHLLLYRKIQKEANTIKIISLINTGDAQDYKIEFVGYDPSTDRLVYYAEGGFIFYIKPVEGTVDVVDKSKNTKVTYY